MRTMLSRKKKKKKKNFMAPFYGWGSTASRLEPLRGGSLLFTTKFPEVPGTHFIELWHNLLYFSRYNGLFEEFVNKESGFI